MTEKRWRVGVRKAWKRSDRLIGTSVCSTGTIGTRSPSLASASRSAARPGSHWTKFSEIRPSGWMSQNASRLNGAKRCSISMWMRAL